MTNRTTTESQRVRFEEVTPTNEIVARFNTKLPLLLAGMALPIFPGYDDLDDIQFTYITLPSGNIVVLGQYENAPEVRVDLYVDLNPPNNLKAIDANIPALVVETLRYLYISRETAIWFHPSYQAEIERLYADSNEREPITRASLPAARKYEEPFASAFREEIDCFHYALEIYTREKMPERWATLQHNLGLAYYHRTQGARWENLLKSIGCFNKSLEVFERDKYPQKWQINQEDLQHSQKEWSVEKPNLIEDIRARGGENRDLALADLSDAHLSNANLSDANLSGADLNDALLICACVIDADLSGANLSDANLSNATLSGANLSNADLSDAELHGVNLSNANLSNANLSGANLGVANLSGANLSGANLSGARLSGADLINADMSGFHLLDTDLSGTNLSGANLSGFNLSGFDLWNADLSGANLNSVCLIEANLYSADLSDADLTGADLTGADVKNAQFGDSKGISESMRQDLILRGAIFSDNLGILVD